MRTSDAFDAVAEALVAAQMHLRNPAKNRTARIQTNKGGTITYDFAELDSIVSEVRPFLMAHGLAAIQETISQDSVVGVVTRIVHASGQWIEMGPLWLPASGDARAIGSAITYGRRYSLLAALGLAAGEDDDGSQTAGAGRLADGPDRIGGVAAPAPASSSGASTDAGQSLPGTGTHPAASPGVDDAGPMDPRAPEPSAVPDSGHAEPSESSEPHAYRGEGASDPTSEGSAPSFPDLRRLVSTQRDALEVLNRVAETEGRHYTPKTAATALPEDVMAAMALVQTEGAA